MRYKRQPDCLALANKRSVTLELIRIGYTVAQVSHKHLKCVDLPFRVDDEIPQSLLESLLNIEFQGCDGDNFLYASELRSGLGDSRAILVRDVVHTEAKGNEQPISGQLHQRGGVCEGDIDGFVIVDESAGGHHFLSVEEVSQFFLVVNIHFGNQLVLQTVRPKESIQHFRKYLSVCIRIRGLFLLNHKQRCECESVELSEFPLHKSILIYDFFAELTLIKMDNGITLSLDDGAVRHIDDEPVRKVETQWPHIDIDNESLLHLLGLVVTIVEQRCLNGENCVGGERYGVFVVDLV